MPPPARCPSLRVLHSAPHKPPPCLAPLLLDPPTPSSHPRPSGRQPPRPTSPRPGVSRPPGPLPGATFSWSGEAEGWGPAAHPAQGRVRAPRVESEGGERAASARAFTLEGDAWMPGLGACRPALCLSCGVPGRRSLDFGRDRTWWEGSPGARGKGRMRAAPAL